MITRYNKLNRSKTGVKFGFDTTERFIRVKTEMYDLEIERETGKAQIMFLTDMQSETFIVEDVNKKSPKELSEIAQDMLQSHPLKMNASEEKFYVSRFEGSRVEYFMLTGSELERVGDELSAGGLRLNTPCVVHVLDEEGASLRDLEKVEAYYTQSADYVYDTFKGVPAEEYREYVNNADNKESWSEFRDYHTEVFRTSKAMNPVALIDWFHFQLSKHHTFSDYHVSVFPVGDFAGGYRELLDSILG